MTRKRPRDWDNLASCTRGEIPLCLLCLAGGRTVPAVCVDHKVPVADGGSMLDPANLQPLCSSCHQRKTTSENIARPARKGPHQTRVVVVCYPPGARVLDAVRPRRVEGDAVLHLDDLLAVVFRVDETTPEGRRIAAVPGAVRMRDALIEAAIDGQVPGTLYVTMTDHQAADAVVAATGGSLVYLDVPIDQCLDEIDRGRSSAAAKRAMATKATAWHAYHASRKGRGG